MNPSSKIRYINSGGSQPETGGIVGRVVALFVGCLAFLASVLVGAVFLAGLLGMLIIGGAIFMLRVWWLRRQLASMANTTGDLEGQYTVIVEEDSRTYRNEDDPRS